MAPAVELSSATFTRLQAHAVPLVDTIETVITRLLDAFERRDGAPASDEGPGESGAARRFNPNTPPSLRHAKALAIEFDGQSLDRKEANWNGLLDAAIRKAKAGTRTTAELRKLVVVNLVEGQKTDEGYRFLSDIGVSVQGQDANGAWKAVCHIAQQLGCPVQVTFVWRDKPGAAFPGVTGQFQISGRSS